MERDQFLQLLNSYLVETITEDQTRLLFSLLEQPVYQELFKEQVGIDLLEWVASNNAGPGLAARIKSRLHDRIAAERPRQKVFFLKTTWLRYAAAVVIVFGTAAYFYYANKNNKDQQVVAANKPAPSTISPGGNKAFLTLADGTKINLDNAANGNLARQGNAVVVKLANGQIVYNAQGTPAGKVFWNTMSTPAGGEYQLILPDGTKVWLNAASSITYPTAFTNDTRQVTITGEAYFEVTKNKHKPFIVDINGKSSVEVLGTIFNINAYDNEASINTTLVEGSVRITKANQSALLKPGQQAVVPVSKQPSGDHSDILVRSDVNLDQALAWKNGLFNFDGLDLPSVMRQLERWYAIKVQYQGTVDNGIYGGKLYRNVNLSDVLDILEKVGGVHFRLEGKTLTVL